MAFGKKKNRLFKMILRILCILLVISVGIVLGYKLYLNKQNELKASYQTQIDQLQYQADQLKRSVWVVNCDLEAGNILSTENIEKKEISTSIPLSQFASDELVGKILLVDIKKDTPIMESMVFGEVISNDLREEELNMLLLPTNLEEYHYMDIRICFPNGEDYIVLSKKKVRALDLKQNTLWLWVDEKEILTLDSAIVDAYLHEGTKLYTVNYIEPSIQEAAIINYPVNQEVLKLILSDPNIIEEAKKGLTKDARIALEERLKIITEKDKSLVEGGVTKEVSIRDEMITEAEAESVQEVEIIVEPTEENVADEVETTKGATEDESLY